MSRDDGGAYRDLDDRVIVADGLVKIGGLSLYDRFTRWCEANGLNLFVFAWDWRRRLEETVALFVEFLPRFRQRLSAAYGIDPLRGFVLVGHSYGGLIVRLLLDEPNPEMDELSLAIAAATPFYGFGVIIRRWLQGDPYLNLLGKREVIRTICSFAGCYPLAYLDEATFQANQTAFADDRFPLRAYPSQDSGGRAVDPYRPSAGQYPVDTVDHAELAHGGTIARQAVALPRRADKLVCIRGAGFDTVGAITWGTSITPRPPLVPGDGIQPAWGTRLVALPADQCITVTDPDHMFFLEHRETQRALAGLLPCCVD
jgi:pimeloyl-ACP methyl ester carboxylesterase